MNKKRCAVVALLVGGLFAMFMLVLGGISVYLIRQNLEEKRALNTVPNVIVHSPSQGETFPGGNPILANVTAAGVNPIARLELWMDGELVETQTPIAELGIENLTFNALFDLLVEEGIHILYWKAVDSNGLVGQSQPVSVEIVPLPQDAEPVAGEAPLPDAPDEAGPEAGEPPPAAAQDEEPGGAQGPGPSGAGAGPSKIPPKGSTSKKPDLPNGATILEVTGIAIDIDLGWLISLAFSNMPEAPSGLQAGFEDCSIRLVWFDNADNETGYDVWIQRLGGPPQRIATLPAAAGIGPVTYEFRAPPFGIYSVWVEAVNGTFSQPSEIKGVAVNDEDCPQTALAAMLEEGPVVLDWDMAEEITLDPADLETEPLTGPRFADLPAVAKNAKKYAKWNKDFLRWVRQNRPLLIYRSKRFNLSSNPQETKGEFLAHLAQAAREKRDLEVEKLRRRYSSKFNTLNNRLMRTEQAVMREKEQSQSSKIQTAISFGTAILGAFLGRKAVSTSSAGRFGTAMRSASRVRKESMDVHRAQETLEATKLRLAELDQRLQEDIERIEDTFDPDSETIQEILVKPKSSDMTLEFFGLVWMPYRRDARGQLAPDWQ